MYNPYQYQYQQPTNNLIRANGINGAKAFQLNSPNSSVVIFDENENVFYLKTTDNSCFPTLRVFDFTERNINQDTEYITKSEFNQLLKEIQYVKRYISEQQSEPTNAVSQSDPAEPTSGVQ